jgi:hypothetical protein
MSTKSIIKHVASITGVVVVLSAAAMQSAQAADNTWFLHQLQQTDGGYDQNDDSAPASSPRAIVAHKKTSGAAADKAQTPQPDNENDPMNQAPTD